MHVHYAILHPVHLNILEPSHFKPSGRKCIYDTSAVKYLVQVKDDVEAGDEKLRELEQEMKESGVFDTDFSLGDILVDDDESETNPAEINKAKKKLTDFPVVEGEETIVEYVGQYKKACLAKKALLKATRERLEKDQAKGHEPLCFYNFSTFLVGPMDISFNDVHSVKPCCFRQTVVNTLYRIPRNDLKSLEASGSPLAQLTSPCSPGPQTLCHRMSIACSRLR